MADLSICYQHLSARINRALEPIGLNMTQLSILSHFQRVPEALYTIGQLAKTMDMNQPMVTKAVKPMVEKGWLKRQADENDARVTLISLTQEGVMQLQAAQQASFPVIQQGFAGLSDDDLGQLVNLLGKIKHELNASA